MPKPKFCLKCHANHSGECWEYWKAECDAYEHASVSFACNSAERGQTIYRLTRKLQQRRKEIVTKRRSIIWLVDKLKQAKQPWWRWW